MTKTINGYWIDQPKTIYTLMVSLDSWDEEEDAKDSKIFFYTDGEDVKVGDVIASDFVVTAVF